MLDILMIIIDKLMHFFSPQRYWPVEKIGDLLTQVESCRSIGLKKIQCVIEWVFEWDLKAL